MLEQDEDDDEVGKACLAVLSQLVSGLLAALACLADPEDCPGRAGDCLALLSRTCGARVLETALPLVAQHLGAQDWRQAYSAVIALACLGSCPGQAANMARHVGALGPGLLAHSSPAVRQATGWALTQLCSLQPVRPLQGEEAPWLDLLSLASQALTTSHELAERACSALSCLALHLAHPSAGHLIPKVLDHLLPLLLNLTTLPSLLLPALSALEDLATLCPPESHQLLLVPISSLLDLLALPPAGSPACLCSCLLSLLRLLQPPQLAEQAPRAATLLLPLLHLPEAEEEALACLGPVVEALGPSALPLVPTLLPQLSRTISQDQDPGLARAGLGLTGDLYRALGPLLAPHSDPLLQGLLTRLASTGPQPVLLLALTDVVLGLEHYFSRYSEALLGLLEQALETDLDLLGPSLELYGALMQGSKEQEDTMVLLSAHFSRMLALCSAAAGSPSSSQDVVGPALGLLGDLAPALGHLGPGVQDWVADLLTRGEEAEEEETRTLATWARREVERVTGSQASVARVSRRGEGGEVVYSMRVTVTNRQFVTQEVESSSVTLRLRPGGGVEEVVEATVRVPGQQEEEKTEERRRSRKRVIKAEDTPSKRWRVDSEED